MAFAVRERRLQPNTGDYLSHARADDSFAHGKHVRIVMFAGRFGREEIVHERAADAGIFVGGNRHADTRAAQQNASVCFPCRYPFTYWHGVIRVVYRLAAVAAEIFNFMTEGL